jgi:8-oxo-dGTP pyrophosphatase MutT (NUDIX family)
MQTIDFHAKLDKPQAAFVIFYAMATQPWKDYPTDNSGRHHLTFPVCFMLNRSDGAIGFIGGKVDGNETLEEAAIREVEEEVGHKVTVKLEPLVAHDIGPITTHAFAAEVTYDQLRSMQRDATAAAHFGSEVTGVFLPHLVDYELAIGKGGGLVNLIQTSMAPSVREELTHFLLSKQILPKEALSDLCKRAGYSLEELLV